MNFSFSDQQIELREKIIQFSKDHLNKNIQERDRLQVFDHSSWKKSGELSLPGLCVPLSYGGQGLDPLDTTIALEALGYACEDGGLGFAIAAHLLACVVPLWLHGSEKLKDEYLPGLCNGEFIGANAITEVSAGSDIFNMTTQASPSPNGFVLNGYKRFITNAPVADVVLVYALTDPKKGYFGGVTAFLLDKNIHSFELPARLRKLGVRTTMMGEVQMNNTEVSSEYIVGQAGAGAQIFAQSMVWERICLGGLHLGTMKRMIEKTLDFIKTRKSGGKSLNQYQAISHKLADMYTQLAASRWLTYHAAWKLSQNKNLNLDASVTKLFVSETFKKFAVELLQIYSGEGFLEDHDASRLLRDAMASTIYSGTSEVQKNIIINWL